MKTADSYFRGFPALWNVVAFYLFLLKPAPWIGALAVRVLAAATFAPIYFVHPIRVPRWRMLNLAALVLWAALAALALAQNLNPPAWVAAALAAIAVYFVIDRLFAAADLDHAQLLALITDPNAWAALVTLTALEIVLGVDNVIFVSLLAANLDPVSGRRARQIGLLLALVFRVALLFALTSLGRLRHPLIVIAGNEISWRDIILIGGGLFLIAKATFEIHGEIDDDEVEKAAASRARSNIAARDL